MVKSAALPGGRMLNCAQPGFTFQSKWAEIAIYSEEITLWDHQRYNMASPTSIDRDFFVSLLWKNRDYIGEPWANSTQPDTLREIVVYRIDNFEKAKRGDMQYFINSDPVFRMSYVGVKAIVAPILSPVPSAEGEKAKPAPSYEAAAEVCSAQISYENTAKEIAPEKGAAAGEEKECLEGEKCSKRPDLKDCPEGNKVCQKEIIYSDEKAE